MIFFMDFLLYNTRVAFSVRRYIILSLSRISLLIISLEKEWRDGK